MGVIQLMLHIFISKATVGSVDHNGEAQRACGNTTGEEGAAALQVLSALALNLRALTLVWSQPLPEGVDRACNKASKGPQCTRVWGSVPRSVLALWSPETRWGLEFYLGSGLFSGIFWWGPGNHSCHLKLLSTQTTPRQINWLLQSHTKTSPVSREWERAKRRRSVQPITFFSINVYVGWFGGQRF